VKRHYIKPCFGNTQSWSNIPYVGRCQREREGQGRYSTAAKAVKCEDVNVLKLLLGGKDVEVSLKDMHERYDFNGWQPGTMTSGLYCLGNA
jgi:hypothetical protein